MLDTDFYGNKANYWLGVVEDRNDPIGGNRVRVRILGVHPVDQSVLSTGDLPWALVLMPTTSAGVSGIGVSPHGLVEGSWVFGTFFDGDDKQQPLVMGVLLGKSRLSPSDPCGIVNSSGAYSTPDLNDMYSGGSVPAINVPGNENRERVFNFMCQNGYTPEQASGVIGNMMAESGVNINPAINQKGGNGYGICQWDDRRKNLFAWCRANGYDVTKLESQLLFMMHELNTSESQHNRELKAATTPEQAALAFCAFERPYIYKKIAGKWRCDPNEGNTKLRMGYARDTYEKYGKRSSSPTNTNPQVAFDNQNVLASVETVSDVPTADESQNAYNPCVNPNIVDSVPSLQNDVNPLDIQTLTITATGTGRDVQVNGSDVNSSITYLIKKDGSLERVSTPNSNMIVALEGGGSGFTNSVSSNQDNGTQYYTLAQRDTLRKLIQTLQAKNPNLTINTIGWIGFDPKQLEVPV